MGNMTKRIIHGFEIGQEAMYGTLIITEYSDDKIRSVQIVDVKEKDNLLAERDKLVLDFLKTTQNSFLLCESETYPNTFYQRFNKLLYDKKDYFKPIDSNNLLIGKYE